MIILFCIFEGKGEEDTHTRIEEIISNHEEHFESSWGNLAILEVDFKA
jgi:hypothetical protein